jgi:DmsE family decaheme c-type cytochrome
MSISLPLLLALLAASGRAQTQPPAQVAQVEGGAYVGSDVCKTCHADIWFNFYKNPHYRSIASGKEPPARTGCEGCHGPAQHHIAEGGGKTTIPRAFSLMEPPQVLDSCLDCHARDFGKANIRRSDHTFNGVVCTNCHSIHHSPTLKYLLAKKQSEVCYGCHVNVRADFAMPFKHRVNEGFMQCTDCHNPHGSFAPDWRMAQEPNLAQQGLLNEEPCLKCHVDKRGPFVYEHPPLRIEGCERCHNPHGSTNAKLLRRPVVFTLCLECHTGAGNFGTRNNGITALSSTHNMLDPRYQKCTLCHVRIHGSNSDSFFQR